MINDWGHGHTRGELRRSGAAANGRLHRHMIQFEPDLSATQHQAPAAHIASSDKFSREQEIYSEYSEQWVNVFTASEMQDDVK
jgi:hypothetical protein